MSFNIGLIESLKIPECIISKVQRHFITFLEDAYRDLSVITGTNYEVNKI